MIPFKWYTEISQACMMLAARIVTQLFKGYMFARRIPIHQTTAAGGAAATNKDARIVTRSTWLVFRWI
jgi:hypothetical protein